MIYYYFDLILLLSFLIVLIYVIQKELKTDKKGPSRYSPWMT